MKIKFITLNLWQGGILFDAILDFLKKEEPDILVCQEVYDGGGENSERRYRSFEVLEKELKFKDGSFAACFKEELKGIGKLGWGNAIFSKFPIVAKNTVFYDIPYSDNYVRLAGDYTRMPRNLQQVVLSENSVKLNVFNTQGIWGFDGKDNERRLNMAETIVKEIKDKENVILAGDFNVNQGTKTTEFIAEYITDIFKNELVNTFNMKRKDRPGYATAVVDRIFVSKNIKVLEHYCPRVDVSDHLPLVVVLDIL